MVRIVVGESVGVVDAKPGMLSHLDHFVDLAVTIEGIGDDGRLTLSRQLLRSRRLRMVDPSFVVKALCSSYFVTIMLTQ